MTPSPRRDPWYVRTALVGATFVIVVLLIGVPLVNVFTLALGAGLGGFWRNLTRDPDTLHSVFLTAVVAPVAVALNAAFGVAAAWCIARFEFRGRTLLTTLIDLPFSVSPVVVGLSFILVFGVQSPAGGWLALHGYRVIFAPPGLVLVTMFVTVPFIARELIPVMRAVGPEEEVAARSLGASGWQMFTRVTLPNIRWGLAYGVILANARAMGEFGAIAVVSGRITGQTDTMPLRVEKLIQEYNQPAAYAVASLLSALALATLVLKGVAQARLAESQSDPEAPPAPEPT